MAPDLKRALELCGFQPRETFSVAAIRPGSFRGECFVSVVEAEHWLSTHEGAGLYFCGNPLREGTTGKPEAEDVLVGRVVLIDCDPERGPAGEADGSAARDAIFELSSFLETFGVKPAVVFSGRGHQAWLRVDTLDTAQRRRLARGLAVKFSRDGAKFDGTHNLDRLMRLPGSVNPKTGKTAEVVSEGNGVPIDAALLETLGLPEAPEVPVCSPADFTAALESDLAAVKGDARRLWNTPAPKGERSKRDFLFVLSLVRSGAAEAVACRLLWALPSSKAREDARGENYWTSTIASVRRRLTEDERKKALATALPDKITEQEDPSVAFDPAALDALLFVRETGTPQEWESLRLKLKKAKVRVGKLEQAMGERQTATAMGEGPLPLRYVAQSGRGIGWFRQSAEGCWNSINANDARSVLRASGADVDSAVNHATLEPWTLVNEPFQGEELDGRRWNKDGARLAFTPEPGEHPTWDLVLTNIGRNLDGPASTDEWCQANGITTGADYLRVWIAKMFQAPKERGAYLIFFGEQEDGKSFFHEMLRMLFDRGYISANHALTSREGFNGELANAVLCVIEEIDLSDRKKAAHERIKAYVTGLTISVRAMYLQAYDLDNNTHWVHTANPLSYMAVLPGDTRITAIEVTRVPPEEAIAKEVLLARLRAEAPAFLSAVTTMPLPTPKGRLLVPAIATRDKLDQEGAVRTDLEAWLETADCLELSETRLVGEFLDSLPVNGRSSWDRGRVLRELPPEVRRDRRLTAALRGLGTWTATSAELLERLPRDARQDCGNAVALGRALGRLVGRLPGLSQSKAPDGSRPWTFCRGSTNGVTVG